MDLSLETIAMFIQMPFCFRSLHSTVRFHIDIYDLALSMRDIPEKFDMNFFSDETRMNPFQRRLPTMPRTTFYVGPPLKNIDRWHFKRY